MGKDNAAHYEVLGVDPSASVAEIRRSYLRLARESHPDYHGATEAARASAELRMRRINASWAVLGDVDQRSAYDRARLTQSPRAPFHTASHGGVEEPDRWAPFDTGTVDDFDDGDDRPITASSLPSWLKTTPALGVLFGLAALIFGSLVNLEKVAQVAMLVLLLSLLLFLAAPLVALSLSKGQDRRP